MMMHMVNRLRSLFFWGMLVASPLTVSSCGETEEPDKEPNHRFSPAEFAMGADLSYVNQVEDHGGIYRDSGIVRDPFFILKSHGCNYVRVRLWHHPEWVKDVYGNPATPLYSGYDDVEKTIGRAKALGMAVNLDLHFSDFWADPGRQNPPAAWKEIRELSVLKDSVYNYVKNVLSKLAAKGLMPEMIQIGNETNCGLMMTGTQPGFPLLDGCNGAWMNLGEVINAGIRAVRDASVNTPVKPLVALHIADPKNVEWWFSKITTEGKVTGFDVIGISYYPLWHTTVALAAVPGMITRLKTTYAKKVMIMETAYPWSSAGSDSYNNLFGSQTPLEGFPFTPEGQLKFLKMLTQEVINAGGTGIFYWEPAWITSSLKDSWGTGSSWENATFFDFSGNRLPAAGYMNHPYELK